MNINSYRLTQMRSDYMPWSRSTMNYWFRSRRVLNSLPIFLAAGIFLWAVGQKSTRAQSASTAAASLSETALTIAPEDVAFFSTSVNLRAGWQELVEGNFVSRLRQVPYIQQLEAEARMQWENAPGPAAQAKMFIESPNGQNLLGLASDLFSNEIFVYGGDDWCDMIDGFVALQSGFTTAMNGGPEAIEQYIANLTKADIDKIRIPTTVLGFRMTDDENARLQLDALEGIIRLVGMSAEEAQPFLSRLRRSELEEGQTLSISLDTSLIPMESLGGDEREVAERFVELLEGRTVSFAIGVKDNILLLAMGEEDTVISEVGEASSTLLDHPRMELLKKADTSRLRAVSFASKKWRVSQWRANFDSYFQRLAAQLEMAIKTEADSVEDLESWLEDIRTDAKMLDSYLGDPNDLGAALAWGVATDSGSEGYGYDWSNSQILENAAPLSVLENVGSSPLMLLGLKQKENEYAEGILDFMIDRAPIHIRRFIALAEEQDERRNEALEVFDRAWPLVIDAYGILKDKIGPSMDKHESVFVAAGQWTTTNLGPNAPPVSKPLPIPELAFACKLTNRDQFINGCVELFGIADRVVDLVRDIEPGSVPPNYVIPRPDEESIAGGKRYFYQQLSSAVPLEGFNPQLSITEDVLVFGYSERQVDDMLVKKQLRSRPAWMTPSTPVAAVSFIDMAGMVTSARPWLEFGLSAANPDMDQPLSNDPGPIPTGNDVLQIWDCFTSLGKAAATVTVSNSGPTATRWVWVAQ